MLVTSQTCMRIHIIILYLTALPVAHICLHLNQTHVPATTNDYYKMKSIYRYINIEQH